VRLKLGLMLHDDGKREMGLNRKIIEMLVEKTGLPEIGLYYYAN
jgi:hypothetical protein